MRPTRLLTPFASPYAAGLPHPDTDSARAVEAVLADWLRDRLAGAASVDRVFCEEVARPLADFVLRGGRRVRARLLWWGWRAAGGAREGPGAHAALRLAAALELLQAFALIHDDVMDRSELRRGTATVHVELAALHRAGCFRGDAEHFGTGGAVLAGDLALVWAEDLLAETRFSHDEHRRVRPLWRAMRTDMVAGQYLDLRTQSTADLSPDRALRVAALKTAAYTVQRPLGMGAALAGASEATRRHLDTAGRTAGIAFQLRDDLDGVFGEPADTGKPSGEDVREGKPTYLTAVALHRAARAGDHEAEHVLRAALGDPRLTPEKLAEYRQAVTRVGAHAAVAARIEALVARSTAELSRAGLRPRGERQLARILRAATRVPSRPAEPAGSQAPAARAQS